MAVAGFLFRYLNGLLPYVDLFLNYFIHICWCCGFVCVFVSLLLSLFILFFICVCFLSLFFLCVCVCACFVSIGLDFLRQEFNKTNC